MYITATPNQTPQITFLYGFTGSMSFSATPSFFPMMMIPTPTSSTALLSFNETVLITIAEGLLTDSNGTILGATGLGLGGTAFLLIVAKYFGLFGGGKKPSDSKAEPTESAEPTTTSSGFKGLLQSKLSALKVFAVTLVKNPSKLVELVKNPKEALKEVKKVLEEAPPTQEITSVVTVQEEVESSENQTSVEQSQQALPIVPVVAIKKQVQRRGVYIPPSPSSQSIAKPTTVISINKQPVTIIAPPQPPAGSVVKYVKRIDQSIYKEPTTQTIHKEPSTILSMHCPDTIVPDDVECHVIEDAEEDELSILEIHGQQQQQEVQTQTVEETEKAVVEESVDQTNVPGVIQNESDKVQIEFDKAHLEEITALLNALKKQYDIIQ